MVWQVIEEGNESLTDGNRLTQTYVITETDNLALARARLIQELPKVRQEQNFGFLRISRIKSIDRMANADNWRASVLYGVIPVLDEGEFHFTRGTRAGRETITRALGIFDAVAIGSDDDPTRATSPIWDLSIGVDSQGNAQGVDVPVTTPFFTIRTSIEADLFTDEFARSLDIVSGRVCNNAEFFGYEPYEVKFLTYHFDETQIIKGVTTPADRNLATLSYDFEVSLNQLYDPDQPDEFPGVVIDGLRRPISKPGWAYLDTRRETITLESTPPPEGSGFDSDTDTAGGKAGHVATKWKTSRVTMARAMWTNVAPFDFDEFGIGSSR